MTGTAVSFGTLDWAVVALYFLANTAICVWAALKKEKDTADYFLASRSAGWFLIGSSIFASNIGAEHLIGLAGSGAGSGMAFAHWGTALLVGAGARLGVRSFYLRANVFTTPEFLERRYTPGTRTLLSGIFLASYILTKASVTIFAGAFAIQTILGYETIHLPLFGEVDFFWFSAAFLVIITGVFVVAGGMLSVLWTEAMHVPVLLAGSACCWSWVSRKLAAGTPCSRPTPTTSTCGDRCPRPRRPRAFRDSCSIRVRRHGWVCCCALPSSDSGTGVPTSTSCNACCLHAGSSRRGRERSSRLT
jgi:Na+/proline symporter